MKPDLAELRGQIERDIRISIWNAAKWQGSPDEVAQSLIRKAMEDPCMERALAATEAGMGAGWRPIEEAPRDGTWFLAWFEREPRAPGEEGFAWADTIQWEYGGWWDGASGVPPVPPIAWQPLPSPPPATKERRDG